MGPSKASEVDDKLAESKRFYTSSLTMDSAPTRKRDVNFLQLLSAKFHIDPTALATVIRLVESFEALGVRSRGRSGGLRLAHGCSGAETPACTSGRRASQP